MPTSPSPRPRSGWLSSLLMGLLGTVAVAAFAARAQARQAKRAAARSDAGAAVDAAPGEAAAESARPPLPARTPLRRSARAVEDAGPVLSVADIGPLAEAASVWSASEAASGGSAPPPTGATAGTGTGTAGTVTWEGGEAPVGDVLSSWGAGAGAAGPDVDPGGRAPWAEVVVPGPAAPSADRPVNGNGVASAAPLAAEAAAPAAPAAPRRPPAADVSAPPRRRRWPVAVLAAVLALVALAGVLVATGGDDTTTGAEGGPAATTTSTAAGTPATPLPGAAVPPTPGTSSPVPADAQAAFAQAAAHLETVGSYAYGGTFRSLDVSAARPSLWLDTEVTVLGEVELGTNRVRETAIAPGGATETVIDGATVHGRSAETVEGLAEASYQVVSEFSGDTPARKGAALLPTWLAAAVGAQPGTPDAQGRATYTAVLPGDTLGAEGGDMPEATMTLTLDGANNPANLLVMATTDELFISYDLTRLGTPFGITPPA